MVAWIKSQWSQLPHQLQAGITVTASALFVFIGKNALTHNLCSTWACVESRWPDFMDTGLVALFTFYMKPNKGTPPTP